MSPDVTQSLLDRWNRGDQSALHDLITAHVGWVRTHVRKRLGDRMRERAETGDIVQEAMVQVLEDGPRFRVADGHRFRGLLAAIVENVLRMENRFHHRDKRSVSREERLATEGILDLTGTGPTHAASRNEEGAWLEFSMQLLAPPDREVLKLRQWEGLSFAELGTRLSISALAARSRFQRAVGRLAVIMKQLQEGGLTELLTARGYADGG